MHLTHLHAISHELIAILLIECTPFSAFYLISIDQMSSVTHTRLTALSPGLPG